MLIWLVSDVMRTRETDPSIARVITALAEILYLPASGVTAEMCIADLGLDSFDLLEAGLELEIALDCALSNAHLAARTIGDLAVAVTTGKLLPVDK